jgi:hypothetical protein
MVDVAALNISERDFQVNPMDVFMEWNLVLSDVTSYILFFLDLG